MITYRVSVQCEDCKAVITYIDEKPSWKSDDISEQLEEAREFVKQNPTVKHIFGVHPRYVSVNFFTGETYVEEPVTERYVECPSCDGKAYMGSADPIDPMEGQSTEEAKEAATT